MKIPSRFIFRLALLGLASTAVAFAHPGHDDGHELVWEASHWLSHPLASLLCVSVLGVAVVLGFRLARRARGSTSRPSRPGS